MRKQLRKLFAVLLILLLSACAANVTPEEKGEETPETAVPEKQETEGFVYTFSPHVMAEEYKKIYGPGIEESFYKLCDAVLAGEESFPCESREKLFQLFTVARTCFPLGTVPHSLLPLLCPQACSLCLCYYSGLQIASSVPFV